MDYITGRIELFHSLYLICLICMLIFLIAAIFLFFRLDMLEVIGFFTGRQEKRGIQKIQQGVFEEKASKKSLAPDMKNRLGLYKTNDVKIRKVDDIPVITITRKLENGTEEVTDILANDSTLEEETEVLQYEKTPFYVEREILLIHTNEIIEWEE